jgi:hypothetical protein
MADKYKIDNSINYRFKDLGDGSYAPVMALDGGVTISSVTVSDVEISNDVGNAIPTEPLGLPGEAWQVVVGATAEPQILTPSIKRISIKARGCDMRYSVSGVASATTSHFIEAGERLDLRVNPNTTVSVVKDFYAIVNGSLEITELQ